MKLKALTIKDKLICLVMFVCLFVLTLSAGVLFGFLNYTSQNRLVQETLADAAMIADNCNFAVAFQNKHDVKKTLRSLQSKKSIVIAAVYIESNDIFASYIREDATENMIPKLLKEKSHFFDKDSLVVFEDIILDDEKIGTLVIRSDLSVLRAFIRQLMLSGVVVLVMALALAYVLSAKFQRLISAPILKLTTAAKKISNSKDYSVRVKSKSADEIGSLIDSFNEMLEKIEQHDTALTNANDLLQLEISQRRKAEKILKESQTKLRQSNDELQNFAYITSHDLREPLRKIISFGILLAESLEGRLDEDQQENLQFMIDGADRMQDMIVALLTYSRITTKVNPYEVIKLQDIIDELKKFDLSIMIEENEANIIIPRPLPEIWCDPMQVRQLMQNLISNAIKYHKQGILPEITITTEMQDNNMVKIMVSDNGIGIKPEYFKNIFILFKQLHQRGEYEGNGIGLSVCKKIVERHGGNIGVSSEHGKGSIFWFTIPSAQKSLEFEQHEVTSLQDAV